MIGNGKVTNPMMESFSRAFKVYRREIPKINTYLEAKIPGRIPAQQKQREGVISMPQEKNSREQDKTPEAVGETRRPLQM